MLLIPTSAHEPQWREWLKKKQGRWQTETFDWHGEKETVNSIKLNTHRGDAVFRSCILQTLYRVILNWPGSMDSIERRNSKENSIRLLSTDHFCTSQRKFLHLVCLSQLHIFLSSVVFFLFVFFTIKFGLSERRKVVEEEGGCKKRRHTAFRDNFQESNPVQSKNTKHLHVEISHNADYCTSKSGKGGIKVP